MYTITFYASETYDMTKVIVHSVEAVRIIVESCANIMVEWGEEWGDAVDGHAVTDTLAKLIA